jgi:hypothetical protein
MMALPGHLAPWASQLRLFPGDIAQVLGDIAHRLSSLLSGAQIDPIAGNTPHGFNGITRAGSYDRLLLSEWMLHDEIPDEFMRRVASGEHAFFRRAYRGTAGSKRILAVFDAGPLQLGSPRIAQLALLLVLAQRAERQGAALSWGILQSKHSEPSEELHAISIRAFLNGRSHRVATIEDVTRWDTTTPYAERWVIGPPSLVGGCTGATIAITDVPFVARPQLQVRVRTFPTARAREAILELPIGQLAAQVIRDPFPALTPMRVVAGKQADNTSLGLLLSHDGRRLHVRDRVGTLHTFHVPNSALASPGAAAAFIPPDGENVVAVGYSPAARRHTVLTIAGTELRVHVLSKRCRGSQRVALRMSVADWGTDNNLRELSEIGEQWWCRRQKIIFALADESEQATDVVATRTIPGALVWATTDGGELRVRWARSAPPGITVANVVLPMPLPPAMGEVILGRGTSELLAFRSTSSWIVCKGTERHDIVVPADAEVVGVVDALEQGVALIAADVGRKRLLAFTVSQTIVLATSATPMTDVFVGVNANIAFATKGGEVVVYSCSHGVALLSVRLDAT